LEVYDSPGVFRVPGSGHTIGDTAPPGKYDFEHAFFKSSNTYFIHYGMNVGLRKILEVAKRFHLGEKTQVGLREVAGWVPAPNELAMATLQPSLPDVCIGQEITVSPLQMACLVTAIANGGKLFWPRMVISSRSPDSDAAQELTPPGRVRDQVTIRPEHLALIRRSMVDDTEAVDPILGDASAYKAFHRNGQPVLPNFRVAAKTGTAEVKSGTEHYKTTWFVSYAPYENPRYAVVVMVDHGDFGGTSCAPIACDIYKAIIQREQGNSSMRGALAQK
jgi:penicillin-binding protein 2